MLGHFGNWIGNNLKVLKYGAGERRRESVGPLVLKNEVVHRVKAERTIVRTVTGRRPIGLVTSCVELSSETCD
jgi:hypothetical protein